MSCLGEVASLERKSLSPEEIETGTSYLGLEHIECGGRILGYQRVGAGELQSNKFIFDPGTLLYGKLRPYLAKICIPDREGCCSTDILPIRPSQKLNISYLKHVLLSKPYVDKANSLCSGANLPRISPSSLLGIEIPLPPLEEQRRIAEILDRGDELRRKRLRALDCLSQLGQAIFVEMFGDLLSSKNQAVALGEVCDVRDGTHDSPRYVDAGFPLLTSKNFSGGRVDYTGAKLIGEGDFTNINKRSKVDKGDIVMPMIGTIGGPVIVDFDPDFAIKNVALIKFANSPMNPEFIREALDSRLFRSHVASLGRGGTQKFVSLGDLRCFKIPFPCVSQQNLFAERVRALRAERARHVGALTSSEALLSSLQHRALSGELKVLSPMEVTS